MASWSTGEPASEDCEEAGVRGQGGNDGGERWASPGSYPGQTEGVQTTSTPTSHGPGRLSVWPDLPAFTPSPSLPPATWMTRVPGLPVPSLPCWSLCTGCNNWGLLEPIAGHM